MVKTRKFDTIAIIGAGVMGTQIAALMANVNCLVKMFDIKDDEEPNRLSELGKTHSWKNKTYSLISKSKLTNIQCFNLTDHLSEMSDCDLIIEAISENIAIKINCTKQSLPISIHCIVTSNTSSIPIQKHLRNYIKT